jgi:hypothetical protein
MGELKAPIGPNTAQNSMYCDSSWLVGTAPETLAPGTALRSPIPGIDSGIDRQLGPVRLKASGRS